MRELEKIEKQRLETVKRNEEEQREKEAHAREQKEAELADQTTNGEGDVAGGEGASDEEEEEEFEEFEQGDAACVLTLVSFELPTATGFRLNLEGTKPSSLTVSQVCCMYPPSPFITE